VKEPLWARSRYRDLALYYHGFACLVLKDYLAAGRSLNQITTFTEPTYGTHARYLLARVLHHGQEHPEAMAQYEGVLADYEAQKIHSIMDHEPALARHALFWLAKAQLGVAEGGKEETQWVWRERALGSLRRAEKLAAAANGNEMGNHAGRTSRGAILLELADLHLQTQKPREAVTIFREILDQRLLPGRAEEVCQRRVSALSLAGDLRESDALAARFQEKFPMSSLLADVVFRRGENAYFLLLGAEAG